MPSALSWFCLVDPVICSLSDDYMKKYSIQHTGKRKTEMDNYRVTFMENNAVFNVVSKPALPEDVADELPKHVALERACM